MSTLFDPAFRAPLQSLDLAARRNWGSRFLGRKLDRRWAGGSEFVGHSDYTSGDDFRCVDWPICARHDELVTRQYRGSEDRIVYLLLDSSANMALGEPSKFDAARRIAGALGYLALANLDRVSVVSISDRLVSEMIPLRGRRNAARLFRHLDELRVEGAPIRLLPAVEAFVRERPQRGSTVLLSDLFDPRGFEGAIDLLVRRGFPPYLVQVLAPEDQQPQLSGNVMLVEPGTGRRRTAWLESLDRANYRRALADFRHSCRRYCARRGIGLAETSSDTPPAGTVLKIIRTCTARMYGVAGR